MKHNTTIFFVVTFLLAFLSQASTKCSNHQGWVKVKSYLQTIATDNTDIQQPLQKLITAFEGQSESTSSESDLGVCSAYVNQKSCCNKGITNFFDKVVLFKTKKLLKADNIFHKFLKFILKITNNKKCAKKDGVTQPTTIDQLKDLAPQIPGLKTLIDGNKDCKLQFVKQISSQARGAVCFACAGSENLKDYIDSNGKLILSQASVTNFQSATKKALGCYSTLLTQTSISDAVTQISSYLLLPNDSCIKTISDGAFQNFLNKIKSVDDKDAPICKGLSLFSSDDTCENSMAGDIDPTLTSRFLEINPSYRVLSDDSVQASTPTGGIQSYVTSPTDDKISEDGTLSVDSNFDDTFGMKYTFSLLLLSLMVLLIQ